MRFAIETISPQRAAELLQGNYDNRKLDKAKVNQWAEFRDDAGSVAPDH